jgi:hypothetical protein
MHKEELHNLYSLPNAIRVIKEQETDGTCCMNIRCEKYVQNCSRRSGSENTMLYTYVNVFQDDG